MEHARGPGSGFDLTGGDLAKALASGNLRLTRERIATESLDQYGRPFRRLAERLVVESDDRGYRVVVAPSAFRSLPSPGNVVSRSASRVLARCYGCLLSLITTAIALLALPLAIVAGYVWSGRTAGGGVVGIGVWALALAVLALGPRTR